MIYEESLEKHRREARKRASECWEAWKKLKHKDSNYAKEIYALGELHDKALYVYEDAPDSLRLRK